MMQILESMAGVRLTAMGIVGASVHSPSLKVYNPQRALIVGILVAVVLVVRAVIMMSTERRAGVETTTGPAGGAICPRCGRPFALSLLSPHLMGLKLARCPQCGRWGMVSRADAQDLAAAERRISAAAQAEASAIGPAKDEAEALRRQIEDSRYQ